MIEVYLVRHAIAEQRDFVRWPDDAERPLSPAGTARFPRRRTGLRVLVPEIDVVLTSPYARSVQTAEVLADETGWPAAQPAPQLAGHRSAADALSLLRSLEGVRSVALVGHEPCLSSLVSPKILRRLDPAREREASQA